MSDERYGPTIMPTSMLLGVDVEAQGGLLHMEGERGGEGDSYNEHVVYVTIGGIQMVGDETNGYARVDTQQEIALSQRVATELAVAVGRALMDLKADARRFRHGDESA